MKETERDGREGKEREMTGREEKGKGKERKVGSLGQKALLILTIMENNLGHV